MTFLGPIILGGLVGAVQGHLVSTPLWGFPYGVVFRPEFLRS